MIYNIIDIIEEDYGCEGIAPGEEPMITLILSTDSGEKKSVRFPDAKAYELGLEIGGKFEWND